MHGGAGRTTRSLFDRDIQVIPQLIEAVARADLADGAGARAHHQRLCRGVAACELHPMYQLAIGNPRSREEEVVTARKVLNMQHLFEIDTIDNRLLPLLFVARPE